MTEARAGRTVRDPSVSGDECGRYFSGALTFTISYKHAGQVMQTFPTALLRSLRTRTEWVFLIALSAILMVGLAACDSGGSNGENGEGEIAQTFQVTVASIEGTNYPYSDQNRIGVAYAIDGEVGAEITLERGKTYAFELNSSVDSGPNGTPHPFYVGETAEGGSGDEYSDGVENAKATSGTVRFTPSSGTPNELYYQCGNHVYMGGRMTISDSGSQDTSGGGGGGTY